MLDDYEMINTWYNPMNFFSDIFFSLTSFLLHFYLFSLCQRRRDIERDLPSAEVGSQELNLVSTTQPLDLLPPPATQQAQPQEVMTGDKRCESPAAFNLCGDRFTWSVSYPWSLGSFQWEIITTAWLPRCPPQLRPGCVQLFSVVSFSKRITRFGRKKNILQLDRYW